MASSYPPPPTAGSGGISSPPTTQPQLQPHSPHPLQAVAHSQFDSNAAVAAANAAVTAHHGLQALQAATAIPSPTSIQNSVLGQFAGPADPSYLPANGSPDLITGDLNTKNHKHTRLGRACDLCSQRKVKCDDSRPCTPCKDLGVECTFNREKKRRGPPNKHAEAARKRTKLDTTNESPGPHNAAETLISISGQNMQALPDVEVIAPWPVLELLVDDFFTYIHPLAPFPHEPTFRDLLMKREDRTNPDFLALMASMIGMLVASFPRTVRLHLKAHNQIDMYPRAISMVDRCRMVALQARGSQFFNKPRATVHDAATSYFLGLAAGYTLQWNLYRRFMNETWTFVRELGIYGHSQPGIMYRGPPFNHIDDQMGKRIFWVMFLGVRSMAQLGLPGEILLPPQTVREPYPEFPAEVDDQYIYLDQIQPQPEGTVSLLNGFTKAIDIYMSTNALVSVDLYYGLDLEFRHQRTLLKDCLDLVRKATDSLPPQLTLNLSTPTVNLLGTSGFDLLDTSTLAFHQSGHPSFQPQVDFRHLIQGQPERRRALQLEIQKANIYVSHLATRAYVVERYLNIRDQYRNQQRQQQGDQAFHAENGLVDADGDDSKAMAAAAVQAVAAAHAADIQNDDIELDREMTEERERIVQDLLAVLASVSQRNMEPNGASLIIKIRSVAGSLYNDSNDRKGPMALAADPVLQRFLEVLNRLERTGPTNGAASLSNGGADGGLLLQGEEEEFRAWANLREEQERFVSEGGFLGRV